MSIPLLRHLTLMLYWVLLTTTTLAVWPAHAQGNPQGRRIALLIGNAQYEHERRLRNPANDASMLGQVLRDDLKFDSVRVETNLTLAQMDAVIEQFANEATGADTVVFYYSGHGLTGAPERRSYVLPVDARTGVPGAAPLRRQAVAAHEVREQLEKASARVVLMLLDACRDGPGDGRSGSKGLARVGGGNGLLVAYATEEGQIADDGNGSNSPYAAALAQAWRQRDKPILAQLDTVYDLVTARIPGQRPTREGNLRTDAYLDSSLVPPTAHAQQGNIEAEAWWLCRAAVNAVPCDDYLANWPTGRYTSLARTRLREFKTRVPPSRPSQESGRSEVSTSTRAAQVVKDCDVCPELLVVPAGRFRMGSSSIEPGRTSDEGPLHDVWVASFLLGRTEVTQGQWKAVMGANPSRFKACGDECPVEQVSWNDAQQYLKRLSERSGKTYRLPSEAEWEYAARAGTTTPFNTGQTITLTQANFEGSQSYNGSARRETSPGPMKVGTFESNAFGLHDMHGNVWEWVQDSWHDSYESASTDGSAWITGEIQPQRVLRGGAWSSGPGYLRSAVRGRGPQSNRDDLTGFRVARAL